MASIYDLKPRFQAMLRPVCVFLAAHGASANQVTLSAVYLSIAGGATIALFPTMSWPLFLLPVFLFLRMALNAIDGMLAREFNMQSNTGAMLNELGDIISDAALYLPLCVVSDIPVWGVVGVVILGTISEMTGVISVQIGASRRYDGPFGKSDRAFAFGLLAIIVAAGLPYAAWISWVFAVFCALSVATIYNRAKKAIAESDRDD
jgi:phosphatidylglycerophosphate synthase